MSPTATFCPGVDAPSSVHTWTLVLSGDPDALMRVLSTLRRRRWRVSGVHFELGDVHRPQTRLRVSARSAGGRPHATDAWLAGLPDVLDVRRER